MIKRTPHPPEVREMALEKLKEGFASPTVSAYLRERGFKVDPSTILDWKRKAGIQVKRRIKPSPAPNSAADRRELDEMRRFNDLIRHMKPLEMRA